MATTAVMRQRVYDYLFGSYPTDSPFVTRLTASYGSSATSITVLSDTNWAVGDVVENILTGEQFKVLALAGSNVLTVRSAWAGTTTAASSGSTDPLYKNPRFTRKKIDDALAATLLSLEDWGIHVVGNGTIVRANPKEFYEIAETDVVDDLGVLNVYEVVVSSQDPNPLPFRYQYSLGVASPEYSVGHGVHILDWGNTANGGTVYFTYAKKIDDVVDLMARQEELVVVGATAQMMGGTIAPSTQDPGARTDRTVQPGQTSRDVRYFQGRFYSEARIESAKLGVERDHMLRENPKTARARRWVG